MLVGEVTTQGWYKLLGVLIILDVAGTITLPVRCKLQGKAATAAVTAATIELVCPRCRTQAAYPLGSIQCRRCTLKFHVALEV